MNKHKQMPLREAPAVACAKETRCVENAAFRAIDEGENGRKFELSFSSEDPVARWYGQEILDHTDGSMDLTRLQEIGVVLFNHRADQVVGKVTRAWTEDGRGKAEIKFDEDEASEIIRKKVQSGTLKGVSVGYSVDSWEEVAAGKKSKDGRFTGPCYIAARWTPLEISIVSVPADATVGVGRSAETEPSYSLDVHERIVQVNENQAFVWEKRLAASRWI